MRRLMLAALVPFALACAESRQSIVPVLQSAPPTIAGTTIAVDMDPSIGGYWSHNPLGPQLVRALAHRLLETLSRAGYSTIRYSPEAARVHRPDLSARLTAELSGSTKDLQSVTRLELVHDGKLVGRFEVKSPEELPHLQAEMYPEYVAVTLANRMLESQEILAIAPEPRRRTSFGADSLDMAELGEGPVVALFDITDASGQLDEPSQAQLSEYLSVRATQALGYRVLPRTSVRELLQEKKQESYRTCVEESCQIELGKSLAAEKMLATKLIRLGATCALTTTLFDLKTETAELATSIKTKCAKESLLQGVDDLVDALMKQRSSRPT